MCGQPQAFVPLWHARLPRQNSASTCCFAGLALHCYNCLLAGAFAAASARAVLQATASSHAIGGESRTSGEKGSSRGGLSSRGSGDSRGGRASRGSGGCASRGSGGACASRGSGGGRASSGSAGTSGTRHSVGWQQHLQHTTQKAITLPVSMWHPAQALHDLASCAPPLCCEAASELHCKLFNAKAPETEISLLAALFC